MPHRVNFRNLFLPAFIGALFFLVPLVSHAGVISKPTNSLGLVGYWSFEDAQNTTATDFSGSENDGTLTNMETPGDYVTGYKSSSAALDFDGTNEYISIADDATLSFGNATADDPFSISAWVKMDDATDFRILAKATNAGAYEYVFAVDSNDDLVFNLYDNTSGNRITATSDTTLTSNEGSWIHVTGTYDGSEAASGLKLYVNGAEVAATTGTTGSYTAMHDTTSGAVIAVDTSSGSTYGDGVIDDVRILGRELSAADVALIHSATRLRAQAIDKTNLVAYWSFDEGRGASTTDFSKNSNDGTLVLDPSWEVGRVGSALEFNAATAPYVEVPDTDDLDLTGAHTLMFWIKASDAGNYVVMEKGGSDDLMIQPGSGTSGFFYLTPTNPAPHATRLMILDGTWRHVAAVFDGSSTKYLYVDGEQQHTDSMSTPTTNTDPFYIGSRAGSYGFDGLLDEVRIYDTNLSEAQIKKIYNSSRLTQAHSSQHNRLSDGLIGMWSFNGKYLTTSTSTDVSSNTNDGTLTNSPKPAIGVNGQALDFNGTDSYISIADDSALNNLSAFTASVWVNLDTITDDNAFVPLSKDGDSGYYIQINTEGASDGRLYLRYGSGAGSVGTTSDVLANGWNHIVMTYDGSNIKGYLNGSVLSGSVSASAPSGMDDPLFIGGWGANGSTTPNTTHSVDGKIDEVRLYNRALTASEIKQLSGMGIAYNYTAPPPAGPWYDTDWSNRLKLTIDNTQVDADLTDYPVYVNLDDIDTGHGFWSTVKTDGADIRVTTSDMETEVAVDVVAIDTTGKTGELRFKADGTLSSSADTDFYVYYGNAGASAYAEDATYGREAVWTSYNQVYAMEGASATAIIDRTSNDRDVTSDSNTPDYEQTGKLGKSVYLDEHGGAEYLNINAFASSEYTTGLYMSAWVQIDSTGNQRIIELQYVSGSGANLELIGTSDYRAQIEFTSTKSAYVTGGITTGTWMHIASWWDGSTWRMFKDGSQTKTQAQSGTADLSASGTNQIGDNSFNPKGMYIDQVMLSSNSNTFSNEWVSTTYNNESTSSSFYTIGSEESQ